MAKVCDFITQEEDTVRVGCIDENLFIDYGRVQLTAKDNPVEFVEEIYKDLNKTTPEGEETLETVSQSLGKKLKESVVQLDPGESAWVGSMGPTDELPDTVTRVRFRGVLEKPVVQAGIGIGAVVLTGLVGKWLDWW